MSLAVISHCGLSSCHDFPCGSVMTACLQPGVPDGNWCSHCNAYLWSLFQRALVCCLDN